MSDTGMTFKLFGKDVTAGKTLKDVSNEAEKTGKSLGHHIGIGSIAAGAALGGLVAGGISAAISGLGGLVSEARDAASASRITAQVIKTTGGAAHVTAAQVDDLATAVSNKTGIDDDAVRASENLLLTFTNVRNEVGKGNKIFTQATGIIQDMSVALGQDASSSTIQLGKALNDPIKGITALSRVGVSFTASQKKQIGDLVKHNNLLGAQKIILKELGREFGGAAAAASDPMQKLGVQISNAGKALATTLLPYLSAAARWISNNLVPALQKAIPWIGEHLAAAFATVRDAIDVFKEAVTGGETTTVGFLGRVGDVAWYIHDTVIPAVRSLAKAFMENIWPAIQQVATMVAENLQPAIESLGEYWNSTLYPAIVKLVPVLKAAGEVWLQVAAKVWVIIGALIVAVSWIVGKLIPAFTWIASKIAPLVIGAIMNVAQTFSDLSQRWTAVVNAVKTVGGALLGWFSTLNDKLGAVLANTWQPLYNGFQAVVSAIRNLWNSTIGGKNFHLPGIPGTAFQGVDLNIPRLAAGAIVRHQPGGILANIGEGHYDEAVIPLDGRHSVGGSTVVEEHLHLHMKGALIIGANEAQAGRQLMSMVDQARRSGRGGRP